MTNLIFNKILKKQLTKPSNYFEQLGNLLFGSIRFISFWIFSTTITTCFLSIFFLIFIDISLYSNQDLQEYLKIFVFFSGFIATISSIFFNTGKFKNIFIEKANNEVERYQDFIDKVNSQTRLVNKLLIEHGLVEKNSLDNNIDKEENTKEQNY